MTAVTDIAEWLQVFSVQGQSSGNPPQPPTLFLFSFIAASAGFFFTFSPLCRVAFYLMYYSCGCCFCARGVQKQWNKGTLWEFPWVWPRCCDLYCFTHQKQRFNCFWSQSATGKIILPTAAKLYSTNTLPVRGPSLSLFSHLYPYSSRPTAVEQTQTSPRI